MNPESEPTQIFKKWILSFKSDFQNFENHIFQKLQKSFEQIQSTCEAHYKGVINEQQEKIERLEQDLDKFFKIQQLMTGMSGNNRSNLRVNGQVKQNQRQSNQDHQMRANQIQRNGRQIMEENGHREFLPEQSNQRNPSSDHFRMQNIENDRHQNNRYQDRQQNEQSRQQQINLLSDSNEQLDAQIQLEESLDHQGQAKLLPLQHVRNHSLRRVALTPNFTRIGFVEYAPNFKSYAFCQANIQYLEKRDLSQVQSINIQCQQMSDEIFQRLTRLSWNNIISLKIDGNLLTNLDPLRNFQLNRLVNLDVSMNELNLSSAQLLANSQFDELIYFTVSFKTGINQECWQILLKNGMNNFPKLQAVDICNSNQLGDRITQKIKDCLASKTAQQREKKILNQRGQKVPSYSASYAIKIKWHQSKQIHSKLTDKEAQQLNENWRNQVNFEGKVIPRVKYQRRNSRKRSRGRGVRGGRAREGNSIASHERQNDQLQISASRQPISRSSMSESRRKIIHKNK